MFLQEPLTEDTWDSDNQPYVAPRVKEKWRYDEGTTVTGGLGKEYGEKLIPCIIYVFF